MAKNTTMDILLDCHNCKFSNLGPHIPTGGYHLICEITSRQAVVRCKDWEYQQYYLTGENEMLKSNGDTHSCRCGKTVEKSECKKSIVHKYILVCFECSENERVKAETPVLLRNQAG